MTKRRDTKKEIADFITAYRAALVQGQPRGYGPTAYHIALKLGLDINTVYYHINRMRALGMLRMQDGNYPTAVIVESLPQDGDK